MGGKRAAVRAALLGPSRGGRFALLVGDGFSGRDGLLDVLQRQGELVKIKLLGFSAELHPLQLTQKMQQAAPHPVPRWRRPARRAPPPDALATRRCRSETDSRQRS